jgi:hypothetical protein
LFGRAANARTLSRCSADLLAEGQDKGHAAVFFSHLLGEWANQSDYRFKFHDCSLSARKAD